ncbi:MFS transporter [Caballeronia sp. LP006]|uniref:MFS transporter n=1 Tax=Caballeronia sp. LP006 TaxID=3038552 RepID=UPI0028645721|nr:MFS transporter [Caballeronia sp. LP006]MDR5832507.1 MFS transporter [Caballeronia sp. LP006]
MRARWSIVSLLFSGGAISYLDRAALSVAAPLIATALNLEPKQLGIVFSVFFLGYAPMSFIGGSAADRHGPWKVMLVAMTIWSIACGATAAATSLGVLIVIRLIFGMGEGPFCATAVKMVARRFEPDRQASAIGLAYAGQPLGAALAGPVVGLVATAWGWRASFVVIACFGLVWVMFWYAFASERKAGAIDEVPAHAAVTGVSQKPTAGALFDTLRHRSIVATCIAFFAYAYVLYFFLSWFPSYLVKSYHLSMTEMGFVSTVPWLAGSIGLAMGGLLCDGLSKLIGNAILARKLMIGFCLLATALCVGLAGRATSVAGVMSLMTAGIFALYVTSSLYYALVLRIVPDTLSGAVSGFINLAANLAGVVAPVLTGYVLAWSGSFAGAFALAAAVAVIGGSTMMLLVRTAGGVPVARHP